MSSNRPGITITLVFMILCLRAWGDEWDVFSELDRQRESRDLVFEQSISLTTDLGLACVRYSPRDPLNYRHSFDTCYSGAMTYKTRLRGEVAGGFRHETAASKAEAFPDEESSNYLRKASMHWQPFDSFYLDLGWQPLTFGHTLIDSLNIFTAFDPDPYSPAAGTFPHLGLGFYHGPFHLRCAAVPPRPDGMPDRIAVFLHIPEDGFLLTLDGGLFFTGLSISALAFLRTVNTPGCAAEIIYSPRKALRFELQYLYSSGTPRYSATATGASDILILDAEEGTENEFSGTLIVGCSVMPMNFLDVHFSYTFRQRGLSSEDMGALMKSYYSQAPEIQETLPDDYSRFLEHPASLLRHLLSLSLMIPRLTEKSGFFLLVDLLPEDYSGQISVRFDREIDQSICLFLSSNIRYGTEGSVFGETKDLFIIHTGIEITL